MPADDITAIVPHDTVLHIVVQKRSLTAMTTEALTDNILVAAAEHPGLPIVLDLTKVTFAPSVAMANMSDLATLECLMSPTIAISSPSSDPKRCLIVRQSRRACVGC